MKMKLISMNQLPYLRLNPEFRRIIGIITLFLFFLQSGWAQPCGVPFSPANTCEDAPYVCTLDGYCASNQGATNSGTPNAFCGQVENNNWVKFVAGSTSFEIIINVNNCNQGSGLQAQFFYTPDCQNFEAVTNCLDPIPNNGSGTLIADDLTIGETYYFMMDGKGSDVCDYQYELVSGTILSPATVIVDPISILCEGGTLDIVSTGVSPNNTSTYAWTTNDGNIISDPSGSSITVDETGIYEVYVEDIGGCTATTMVEVVESPSPAITFEPTQPLNCVGNVIEVLQVNVIGGNQGYDYLWTTTTGNILSGADTANPEVNAAGEYEVSVTDQISGCSVTGSITVDADVDTPIAIASAGGELNCLASQITLDGTGSSFGNNFSSFWFTFNGNIIGGNNSLSPIVDAPGTYELIVTNDENGCSASATSIITLNDAEPTGADISILQPCFGETDGSISVNNVLGGIAPYAYSFDAINFNDSNEEQFLAPAAYPVTIRDQTGCEWDTLIIIAPQPELIANLGPDLTVPLGCEIDLKAQINYPLNQIAEVNWTPDFECLDICIDTVLNLIEDQTYSVHVVDVNGCETRDSVSYFINKKRNIFIPNAFSPNGDGMNDLFMVNGGKDVAEIKTFRVFNRWGELILEYNNFPPNSFDYGWDGRLNGKDLNENVFVYLVEVLFVDGWVETYSGDVTLLR